MQVTDKDCNVEGSESDATYRNKGLSSTTEGVIDRILLSPSLAHHSAIYSASIQLSALASSCGRGRMKGFKADHLLLL